MPLKFPFVWATVRHMLLLHSPGIYWMPAMFQAQSWAVLAWAQDGWIVVPSFVETKHAGHRETGVPRHVFLQLSLLFFDFFPIASMLRKLLVFKYIIPVQFCFMLTCYVWYFYTSLRPLGVDLKCDVGKVHPVGSWLYCQLLIVCLATVAMRPWAIMKSASPSSPSCHICYVNSRALVLSNLLALTLTSSLACSWQESSLFLGNSDD